MREQIDMEFAGSSASSYEPEDEIAIGRRGASPRQKAIGSIVLIVISLVLMVRSCVLKGADDRGGVDEQRIRMAAEVLGTLIASERPASRVLLLTDPPASGEYIPAMVKAAKKGLTAGLGKKGRLVGVTSPEFSEDVRKDLMIENGNIVDSTNWLPSLDCWFKYRYLRPLYESNEKCDVVVSLIGLPIDLDAALGSAQVLSDDPRFAVLMGNMRDAHAAKEAFEVRHLIGAVVMHPCRTTDFPDAAGPELRAAFSQKCCLVTARNISRVIQEYPGFFEE